MSSPNPSLSSTSSAVYQALLDSIAENYRCLNESAETALVPLISALLEFDENEASPALERRWFRDLSTLVDANGARKIVTAVAKVFSGRENDDIAGPINQVIFEACMRHETQFQGRRCDAHLMLVPLLFRGPLASCFPSVLDQSVAAHLQVALKNAFGSIVEKGHEALVVPGNALYTLDEFKEAPVDFFHNVLAKVVKSCQDNPDISRPRLAVLVDTSRHGVMDESLVDLSVRPLVPKVGEVERKDNPAVFNVEELPDGLWITVKLLPVVVIWPRTGDEGARTGPEIASFGSFEQSISQCVALCGRREDPASEGAMTFEVSSLGLFPPLKACLHARMALTRETMMGNLLRAMPFIDESRLRVKFVYMVSKSLLEITIEDGVMNGGVQVHLPHTAHTQIYIEEMVEELRCLGIRCEVSLGDGLLEFPGQTHSVVQ